MGYDIPESRNQHVIPIKASRGGWSPYAYMYVGLEPKYVMYNMTLQDPRFSIHPETFVYDRNIGWVIGCNYFEITFTLCLRSKEFEEQIQQEKFGSVKLSASF